MSDWPSLSRVVGAFIGTSTGQTGTGGSTPTKCTYTTETLDVEGWYDNTNSKYTPQRAGKYMFVIDISETGLTMAQNGRLTINLYKNGSFHQATFHYKPATGTNFTARGVFPLVTANGTTDYFEVYVANVDSAGSSDTIDLSSGSLFTGFFQGT